MADFLTGQRLTADLLNQYAYKLIGETEVTSDSASTVTTGTVEVASLTVSVISGYRYEIRIHANISTNTAATNAIIRVDDTTVGGTELLATQVHCANTTTLGFGVHAANDWTAASTGSQTFKLVIRSNASPNTVQVRASASRAARIQLWQAPL